MSRSYALVILMSCTDHQLRPISGDEGCIAPVKIKPIEEKTGCTDSPPKAKYSHSVCLDRRKVAMTNKIDHREAVMRPFPCG